MKRTFMQIAFFSVLLVCLTALGEEAITKQAAEHFKSGVALFNENKKKEAVLQFREAYKLKPSWKIQYNIGQCEASLRRYGLAIEAFERYLGEGGDEVSVERRDEVIKELDRLRKMVGSVKVHGEEAYDIVIDGIKRGSTPMSSSILVTAGVEHRIQLVRVLDDSVAKEYVVTPSGELDLKGGKIKTVLSVTETVSGGEILELSAPKEDEKSPAAIASDTANGTAGEAAAPVAGSDGTTANKPGETPGDETSLGTGAPDTAETDGRPADGASSPEQREASHAKPLSPAIFFIGVGTTVLFGGGAAGLALAINSKWERSEKNINDDPWRSKSDAISDNIHAMQLFSWISLGVAGAGLILTAVALPFTDWGRRRRERSQSSTFTITPFGDSAGGGVACSGRF